MLKYSFLSPAIQFGLLEREVAPVIEQKVREHVNKSFCGITSIGPVGGQILCFGWGDSSGTPLHAVYNLSNGKSIEVETSRRGDGEKDIPLWLGVPFYAISGIGLLFLPSYLNDHLNPSRRAARKKASVLYDLEKRIMEENLNKIKKLSESVDVYIELVDELSKRLGKTVKIVETKEPHHFLEEVNNLDFFKARAVFLGANAIAQYRDIPERHSYGYWTSDTGETTGAAEYMASSSYIIHHHLGIPVKICD